jgi:predicted short-subunit dehydrogenase-like oxidoreductase (DUF2520 family)
MQTIVESKIIDIIGRGNVATHLHRAFSEVGKDVRMINPHTLEGLRKDADIILISVSDSAIREVADKLSTTEMGHAIVAHTSGSTSITALTDMGRKVGVFYPMQTFSKDVTLDYTKIPFFIEGVDEDTESQLVELAKEISRSVERCDSAKRRKLHIASVFCCNFTNHLWSVADKYLTSNGLQFSAMLPLLEETLRKVEKAHPADVQTGPAARRDMVTIESHLQALEEYPKMRDLYKTLTESIIR